LNGKGKISGSCPELQRNKTAFNYNFIHFLWRNYLLYSFFFSC
jgi:hypothetical protein